MDPKASYDRLLQALRTVLPHNPPKGTADVGTLFGAGAQLANNWPRRGVPVRRAHEAQAHWGINADWILTGREPMMLAPAPGAPAGASQPVQLDEAILADALKVIRGAAQWEGSDAGQVSAREIALAYSLLMDAKERVSQDNLVSLVKAYLESKHGATSDQPA